jgi:hypothetical protein
MNDLDFEIKDIAFEAKVLGTSITLLQVMICWIG